MASVVPVRVLVPAFDRRQNLEMMVVFVVVRRIIHANHLLVQLFSRTDTNDINVCIGSNRLGDIGNLHRRYFFYVNLAPDHIPEGMPYQFHALLERDHEACHSRISNRQPAAITHANTQRNNEPSGSHDMSIPDYPETRPATAEQDIFTN